MRYLIALIIFCTSLSTALAQTRIKPIPTQYIAALGLPTRSSGADAQTWGLWAKDPGPRGVRLSFFPALERAGIAPALWKFDLTDWWLEEHGLIMEAPKFDLPTGRYVVTGGREKTAILTVENGGRWSLDNGATIYDVTHLGCRAANYKPAEQGANCSPGRVSQEQFPVIPGMSMPDAPQCAKLDYQVLIVIGMAEEG